MIFKSAYDSANGAGAFVAMVASVPEPGTAFLVMLAAAALTAGFGHQRARSFN